MRTIILIFLALAFAASISAVEPYVPADAERARWTAADLSAWGSAFEAYRAGHGCYPAGSAEAIRAALAPVAIRQLPISDAWGHAFRITSDGRSYRVVSAGSDGEFDPATWAREARDLPFDADVLVASGGGSQVRTWKQR